MERTVTEDRAKRQKPDDFFYVKSPKGREACNTTMGGDMTLHATRTTPLTLPDAARRWRARLMLPYSAATCRSHASSVARACVPDQWCGWPRSAWWPMQLQGSTPDDGSAIMQMGRDVTAYQALVASVVCTVLWHRLLIHAPQYQ